MPINKLFTEFRVATILLLASIISIPFLGFASVFGIIISGIAFLIQAWKTQEREKEQERDLKKLQEQIQSLKDAQKLEQVISKVKETMKSKDIALDKVLEKIKKPLYAITVQKYMEGEGNSLIKDKLLSLGFVTWGSGIYLLPPHKGPNITESFRISDWIEDTILKALPTDYKYLIQFATVIDLRKVFSKRHISKKRRTIFEVLKEDESFLPELLVSLKEENITLKRMITEATIDFLTQDSCTQSEKEKLKQKSQIILTNLSLSNILDLRLTGVDRLRESIKNQCQNDQKVAEEISANSTFWYTFLN